MENIKREDFEIMAPVGSRESLAAAIRAGADAVYFGIGRLNMRAHSANAFTVADLHDICQLCRRSGVKSYLTVNTVVYEEDRADMHSIIDAAAEARVSAVIASDVAVMQYCRTKGVEVHLSTQLNIANVEALRFYAQFADVVVLARELTMWQVRDIYRQIEREHICGPSGRDVRIEMFCHGALCMAVSGKCYLSLHAAGRSANRGECVQICRRSYDVRDRETGAELQVDNKYIMSPRDLKTIRFIDVMIGSGVRVFKIEGRARGPEYVATVVKAYDEAIRAVCDGTFHSDEARQQRWDDELSTVFNRGFWDGYYQGAKLGEWSEVYGSRATEQRVYCARCMKYFSRLGVAEFLVENESVAVADKVLITGTTTGALIQRVDQLHGDDGPVERGERGMRVSIKVDRKVRRGDRLYLLRSRQIGV